MSFFSWIIIHCNYIALQLPQIQNLHMIEEHQKTSELLLKTSRFVALDNLRGLIIILMALDHANLFIAHLHSGGEYYSSIPAYSTSWDDTLAFLTRFVTHICAPGFFFLMGVGMVLFANSRRKQGWTDFQIMKHFWLRGLILIILQLFIINRIWEMYPGGFYPWPYFGVLYALGGAMIIGTILLRLPIKFLIPIGIIFVFFTEFNSYGSLGFDEILTLDFVPYTPLFDQSSEVLLFFIARGNNLIWVNYPILAWMKVLILGFIFGNWFVINPTKAYKRSLYVGIAFLISFILIRLLNGYGNSYPMPTDFTWIDFLNVVKYPPSVTFVLLTMGINLIFLYSFSKIPNNFQKYIKPLKIFGQVALFMYLTHLILYALLGNIFTPNGTELLVMYLYWVIGLLILYPVAKKYSELKHARPSNSLLRFI